MTILNSAPYFDHANNGWIYICGGEDDTLWIRSVSGNWAQIEDIPVSTEQVVKDFEVFFKDNKPATMDDIKKDNAAEDINPVDDIPPAPPSEQIIAVK